MRVVCFKNHPNRVPFCTHAFFLSFFFAAKGSCTVVRSWFTKSHCVWDKNYMLNVFARARARAHTHFLVNFTQKIIPCGSATEVPNCRCIHDSTCRLTSEQLNTEDSFLNWFSGDLCITACQENVEVFKDQIERVCTTC